jgi:biopolymer transport protein ExbD
VWVSFCVLGSVFWVLKMKRHSKHSVYNPYVDINVIPLVDLTFNLLIIFMLVTPLLETSINLKLPSSTSGEMIESRVTRVVSIERNGRVFLDDIPVAMEKLRAQVQKAVQKDPEVPVLVRADQDIPYRQFVKIVDLLKTAGVKKMGIVTTKK